MRKLKIIITVISIFFVSSIHAQVSVNVNIGRPPLWGPVGYTEVQYYYLPDVEAYYDVPSSMFIYYSGGTWVHRAHLPGRYKDYDLYGGYKVVLTDYHGNKPYSYFKEHKVKYRRGYHGPEQKTIGERPERGNPGKGMPSKGHSNNKDNKVHMKNMEHGNNKGMGHGNVKGVGDGNNKGMKHGGNGGVNRKEK